MSIKLFNINSIHNVREETLQFAHKHSGFLYNLGQSVPVYLVDRNLMDTICPPQILRQLKPDCVQDMMRSFGEEYSVRPEPDSAGHRYFCERMENPENITAVAEKFWRLLDKRTQGSTAVSFRAVYCRSLSSREVEEIERRVRIRIPFTCNLGENRQATPGTLSGVPTLGDFANYQRIFGCLGSISTDPVITNLQSIIEQHCQAVPRNEAIFICMERVVQAACRIKEIWEFRSLDIDVLVEIIFSAHLLHQLAHAYMKTEPARYYTPWGRVMEEGLVAAYAMSCFEDEQSRAVLKAHLSRQPLEYKGFAYFEPFSQSDLQRLLRAWSRNNVRNGLELSLSRGFSHQPLHVYEHVFYLHSNFFSNQPEKFWQTLAMETLREAAGK